MIKIFNFTIILAITTLTSLPRLTLSKTMSNNSYKGEIIKVIAHTAKSQLFIVDNRSSKITWLAKKITGEHTGSISFGNGTLVVRDHALMDAKLYIDINSITDADVTDQASNAKLVTTLKGETFFDSDKYPKASFVSSDVIHTGGLQYILKGKLTIKGITNEIRFPAIVDINRNKLIAKAKITIDRTKYDIKIRSKSFFENLGDKVIDDDFDIDIVIVANSN